ncbi:MAG TPA: alginate lyase family protein [Fibrobacteria bacterium]|nr:alginate lyase family protein [Fibrobacteria bacterium]
MQHKQAGNVQNALPLRGCFQALTVLITCLASEGAWAQPFVHPGILHTQSEIEFARSKVNSGQQPWKGSWDRLTSSAFARLDYKPNPRQEVCAGGSGCPQGESYMPMARDCAAAYQHALRYRLSGDTLHADKAVEILNAWSAVLVGFTGDSNRGLRAGLYGYQFAAAAELLRDYPKWAASDFARFKDMLLTRFYPVSSDFLKRHNNTCSDHYWANWDLANMASILAIGVIADDRAKFDEAVAYFKSGSGTGQVDNLVRQVYPGQPALGQGQEMGRDQGHATLCISLVGAFCKIAYDQGEDLFAYKDNKVLAMAEYTAKYNLGDSVPWTNYTNCEKFQMTAVSSNGRGNVRPAWELIYNHYARRKGLYAPNSRRFAEQLRPEGGGGQYGTTSGGFDQLGFGTLMFTFDVPPTGLKAGTLVPRRRTAPYSGVFGNGMGFGLEEEPAGLRIHDAGGRVYRPTRRTTSPGRR